jgi:DNA invertase Pin-like site-specific DNA recombinase
MVRVSSPGQAADDRQGLQRQRNDIAAFCSIYRLKVVREFEIVMSGADVQRTRAFHEMLAMLRKPKIDGIVVASLDRLFRVTKLSVLAAFKEFEDSGKPLFCDLGEMDLNNPNHQMMISIKAQMAGMERSLIKHRTTAAKTEKRLDPAVCIDKLPLGVEHVREHDKINRGKFQYTKYAYEKVLPAFQHVLCGDTLIDVTEDLGYASQTALRYVLNNKWWLGIKTREHKVIGQTWNPDTEKWTGGKRVRHEDPKEIPTNLVSEPLVSAEVFTKVQSILSQNHSTWTQKKSRLDDFLGNGLLYCRCGAKMYHYKGIGKRISTYVCAKRYRGNGPCDAPRLPVIEVDNEIGLQTVLYMTDEKFVQAKIKEAMDASKTAEKTRELEHAEGMVAKLEKEKRNLAAAMRRAPDVDVLVLELRKVETEIAAAKEKARSATDELSLSVSDGDVKLIARRLRQEFAGFMQLSRPDQKALLAKYIDRIVAHKDEFAGIVLAFQVKAGVPEPSYQHEDYPEPPKPKGGKLKRVVVDNTPIRVLSSDGSKWKRSSTSSFSTPAADIARRPTPCTR